LSFFSPVGWSFAWFKHPGILLVETDRDGAADLHSIRHLSGKAFCHPAAGLWHQVWHKLDAPVIPLMDQVGDRRGKGICRISAPGPGPELQSLGPDAKNARTTL
jgi:hypothetical protein